MMVLILIASLLLGALQAGEPADVLQARQVRALVRVFGQQLEHVALLGPTEMLERQMREHYGPYVADPLLEAWLAEPANAPGRVTSSPWPHRIDVFEVKAVGDEDFLVRGEIVLVTSVEVTAGGDAAAARVPVRLRVEREGGPWQITEFGLIRVERLTITAEHEDGSIPSSREDPSHQPESRQRKGDERTGAPDDAAGTLVDNLPAGFALASHPDDLPPAAIPPCPYRFERCAYYAGDDFEGTTFMSAGVALSRPDLAQRECESTLGNYAVVQNVRRESVGELEFLVFETAEAAMNKVARDVVYRSWIDGACVELVSRIATSNIGVYEPGTVVEFGGEQKTGLRVTLRNLLSSITVD